MVRQRPGRGAVGRRGGDLTAPLAGDGLLRPALQLALDVARIAAAASPAVEPPRAVKPFLRFARLPEQALVAVRRALDEDEEFRGRVEMLADEDELGRAGWLFVVRPDGWEDELGELTEQANVRALAEREEAEERSARRRLRHAEEATERAVAAAAAARAESAKALADLAEERRERRTAQDDAARTARRAASLESERDSAHRRAAEATAEVVSTRAEVEELRVEAVAAQAEAVAARAEVEELRAETAALHAQLVERRTGLTAGTVPDDGATLHPGPTPTRPTGPSRPPTPTDVSTGPVVPEAATALAAAATAAVSLARALGHAAVALGPPPPVAADADPSDPSGSPGAQPASPSRPVPSPRDRAQASARRRPAALPPAVFDDTVEAANHLVRVPEVLVLVDGYNVAKALWPDVEPLELRERLVDALSELAARTGAGIHVVFDGADIGGPARRLAGRRPVRVSFSPPDVEADDVILDLVDEVPVSQPLVVASSDRRVQDGARTRGANVISSAQLAAVLGRA